MHLPMKRFLLLLTMLTLAVQLPARADDQTQAVQQALKDQGFYYGSVDGQGGPETEAAVRRYQIRQGLDVTGKLDEQTLDSLHLGGDSKNGKTIEAVPPPSDQSANAQPPAPQDSDTPAPKPVTQSDRDFLRQHPQSTPVQPPADDDTAAQPPQQPQAPPPPEPPNAARPPDEGQAAPSDYAQFFRKTPYETAPPVVQRSTVQRAQDRLARQGFYRGVQDGQPSDSLSRAIASYQRYADLKVTGRLDMDTLMDMNLLPRRHVVIRPPGPYGPYGDPDAGRDVYRGIWVR